MNKAQHILDCENLSPSALRQKYKAEANSHRAMLGRAKLGIATVSADLRQFSDFLRALGPCPEPGYTVDRLNNADPEYALGKIAWRSKLDQSRNRKNVRPVTDRDGTTRTLPEWAEILGVSRHTLHARRRRGLSDPEVIHGRDKLKTGPASSQFPWPAGPEDWESWYWRTAQRVPELSRTETRAEFLFRHAIFRYHLLRDEIERTIPPDDELLFQYPMVRHQDGGEGNISLEVIFRCPPVRGHTLPDKAEHTSPPDEDAAEKLLRAWDFWRAELRKACRILGNAVAYHIDIASRTQPWRNASSESIRRYLERTRGRFLIASGGTNRA